MHRRIAKLISRQGGYSLLELMITLAVLSVLIMGTIPMAQNTVRRQKEVRLRETLREIRKAVDEFKRDTLGSCPQGAVRTINPTAPGQTIGVPTDSRSRVVIDDCTIFDTSNIDRFPPSLDVLVSGVRVKPRSLGLRGGLGLTTTGGNATDLNPDEEIIKVYLREIPVDPMTGEKDWKFRSSYQTADSDSWDEINIFDVRSASDAEALDGTKYSEW